VKKQDKIALGILIAGLALIGIYKLTMKEPIPLDEHQVTQIKEQIILPQYPVERYRNIPEVQAYLSDLQKMIAHGGSVLPLDRNELDTTAQKVQQLLLKDPDFLSDTKENGKILHNDMMRASSLQSRVTLMQKILPFAANTDATLRKNTTL